MACILVRNVFQLCKFRILSNFQYEELTLSRPLFVSAACYLREVRVKTENNVTQIEGAVVESDRKGKVLDIDNSRDLCPLCPQKIRIPVRYTDVLIISQFIRENGEVLPQHVTGLCLKAHLRLLRVVRQAQYAGLIPEPEICDDNESRDLKALYHTGYKWRKFKIFYDDY